MRALRFSEEKGLRLEVVPKPNVDIGEALIKLLRVGICSTDLEITRGYVPGFDFTLGHEFVGVVVEENKSPGDGNPSLIGKRVVGEINCRCCECHHPDPIFVRNHAPERTVLGIIGRDGCMAEYCTLPLENLHLVPDDVTTVEAAFTEPLAAACRVVEQGAVQLGDAVAVIGDGKLGMLVAHVLARHLEKLKLQNLSNSSSSATAAAPITPSSSSPPPPPPLSPAVTFFGRHKRKLNLVKGVSRILVSESTSTEFAGKFDCVVEASGSPQGILLAAALTRPLGTIVQKSTCSTATNAPPPPTPPSSSSTLEKGVPPPRPSPPPMWSVIANDIVVNEKRVIGSRCGPFLPALELLTEVNTKNLVRAMVDAEVPLEQGVAGFAAASKKGALKVQLVCAAEELRGGGDGSDAAAAAAADEMCSVM